MFRTVELCREKSQSTFQWKVRYTASNQYVLYNSAPFESCGLTWNFGVEKLSGDTYSFFLENYININLSNGKYLIWKLSVKKTDGTEYLSEKQKSYFSFRTKCPRSILLGQNDFSRSDVAPNGVLTFSCTITDDTESSVDIFRTVEFYHEKSKSAVEWKVRYFASERCNVSYESSLFEFCGITWKLVIRKKSSNTMCLFLESLSSKTENLIYKLSIKKTNGTDYLSEEHKYTACSKSIGFGESDLSRRDVAQDGVLTFSCTIRCDPCITESTKANMPSKCKDECIQTKISCAISQEDKSELCSASGHNKLLQDLKDSLISGEDSDVALRVNDRILRAHKVILRSRSPVFKTMFHYGMAESNSEIVDITDCDPVAFQDFLSYLYSGKVEFTVDKVVNLYCVAYKYDVEELKIKCVEFIEDNISVDTFCEVLTLAQQHNESALMEKVVSFFIENEIKAIATENWLVFLRKYPARANELLMKALKSQER